MTVLNEKIRVNRPVCEVFNYVCDFTTTVEWDATVISALKQTSGPVRPGTVFQLKCALPAGSISLEYTVTEMVKNQRFELIGCSRFFDIKDTITFIADGDATVVDYRAEFTFPNWLKALGRRMEPGLKRMGKTSIAGLEKALADRNPVPEATAKSERADQMILPGLLKFTRCGYAQSRKTWQPVSAYMAGKHAVITGASTGLGYSTAMELARRGTALTLVMRDETKAQNVLSAIRKETGNDNIAVELADLSLMSEVDALVKKLNGAGRAIDILVNNAGALYNPRQETAEGIEKSLALLLLSPYRLTRGLIPLLHKAGQARVINVVSGGMYTQKLDVSKLGEKTDSYSGSVAYAQAKRALMVVTEQWAEEWADLGITVNAMHPGWADTPGVRSSLPAFYKLSKAFLRTPQQGADTIVWLSCASEAKQLSGKLFLDRLPHTTHLTNSTKESAEERDRLRTFLHSYSANLRNSADDKGIVATIA